MLMLRAAELLSSLRGHAPSWACAFLHAMYKIASVLDSNDSLILTYQLIAPKRASDSWIYRRSVQDRPTLRQTLPWDESAINWPRYARLDYLGYVTRLQKLDTLPIWSSACSNTFQLLKEAFVTALILMRSDADKQLEGCLITEEYQGLRSLEDNHIKVALQGVCEGLAADIQRGFLTRRW